LYLPFICSTKGREKIAGVKSQFIKLTSSICTINALISNRKHILFATRSRLDEVRNGT